MREPSAALRIESERNRPNVNVPLLRKALEWVEAEAEKTTDRRWYQGDWVLNIDQFTEDNPGRLAWLEERGLATCGTAYCFAGYVAQLIDERYNDDLYVNDVPVSEFAAKELGLTENQSVELFYGGNQIDTIRALCELYAGGPL